MFGIARNSPILQNFVVKLMANLDFPIEHNVQKIHAIKKAMFLINYEHVLGDYFEFGLFEGTSFIGAFHSHLSTRLTDTAPRAFWGFDSFQGFKYFSDDDAHPFFREGEYNSNYANTRRRIERQFKKKADFQIVPGFLEETIEGRKPSDLGGDKVAFAFIDLDLGTPAEIALEFIAPGLQQGSIIMMDDFFAYRGSLNRGVAGAFNHFRRGNPQFEFRRCFDYGYFGQGFIVSHIVDAEVREAQKE